MSREHRPFEIDWANARISIRMSPASKVLDELLTSLPEAHGEFEGYLIPPLWAESFGFITDPGSGPNYFGFRDACSPDVTKPYPF